MIEPIDPENELFNIFDEEDEGIEPDPILDEDAEPEDDGSFEMMQQEIDAGLAAMYGDAFPLLSPDPTDEDWAQWAVQLWESHRAGVEQRLHLVERNRLMRRGIQWLSSSGGGPWREPPKPRDAARVVNNMIGPALDLRVQLIKEQRPGFRADPATSDQDDKKAAEAQQHALEYQYSSQHMSDVMAEAAFWAGTDGCSFFEVFWDDDAGPWHEYSDNSRGKLGDLRTRVLRLEQVRVSAEASATVDPWYVITREAMPLAIATRMYGLDLTEEVSSEIDNDVLPQGYGLSRLGYMYPEYDELYRDQKLVDRITVYCKPSEYLEQGLTLVVVGKTVVFQGPLLFGCIPIIRVTDGSSDPSYFPNPIMDGWIDSQMRINAILSKWVENIRLNAGPRLISKQNGIVGETFIAGTMSVIEIKGLGALNDIARPIEGFSLANDAKELLERETKTFEDLSGWNDVSRGQFSSDTSGRAILAIREQLERTFAPSINAMAGAMTRWAQAVIAGMKWGYDLPRMIGVVGKGRPDLAEMIVSDDLDGNVDVFVDPETLMPMPRALRLFLLDTLYEKGLMPPQEYRRRLPFAMTDNIASYDEDQEIRAKRVVSALRQGQMLPILWMDDESIHQDILQRELILPDDTEPSIRQMAIQRWMMLAQQAQMKMGIIPPGPVQPSSNGGGGNQPDQGQMDPRTQPLQGTNPGVSAAPQAGGLGDEERNAQLFEMTPQQR